MELDGPRPSQHFLKSQDQKTRTREPLKSFLMIRPTKTKKFTLVGSAITLTSRSKEIQKLLMWLFVLWKETRRII